MSISGYISEKIRILSFLLTILIVILHANMAMLTTGCVAFLQEMMTTEVTRIAVPLFFLVSGFLFFVNYAGTWEDYRRKLLSRTRSLLVPYVLFLLLGSVIMFAIGQTYSLKGFLGILKQGIIGSPPIFYPLWFLRDLYCMALMAPVVYWVIKKVPVLLIVPTIIWILGKNPFLFPSTEAMLFFSVGGFLTTKEKWLEQTSAKGAWWCLIIWLLLCFLNTYIKEYVMALPYATHCIILLLGLYTIWVLYDRLYPKLGEHIKSANIYKYSFFIYLVHEPILAVIKKTGLFVFGDSSWTIGLLYILAPILTIWVVYGIGLFLNTYSPKLLSFVTGGRAKR